jgi:hypothetical protein
MKKILFISMTLLISVSLHAQETQSKSSCKKLGYKFDKKKEACKEKKTSKRKRCEKSLGTWSEKGKCSGKLKSKAKRAYKVIMKAAKKEGYEDKLSHEEFKKMAKDLANYSKRKKVRLKKIKISFKDTGKRGGVTGKQLKRKVIKEYGSGYKLYHLEEDSDIKITEEVKEIQVVLESETIAFGVPASTFPPNDHNFSGEGKAAMYNLIYREGYSVFNVTIVESSASALANTSGKYKFSSSTKDSAKKNKLIGLATARGVSTVALMHELFDTSGMKLLVVNKDKNIASGPKSCYKSGYQSGDELPSEYADACVKALKGDKSAQKVLSKFYNQYQYVKVKVEYVKIPDEETIKIIEEYITEIPNAQGILAKFESGKKKKTRKFKKKKSHFKFKRKRVKKKRFKNFLKKIFGGKPKTLKCPKF